MYVEETISKYEKYINPAQAKLFRFMGLASVEGYAEGWTITDSEGKQFIDCLGGYGMFALGHRNSDVVAAVEAELHKMPMSGKVLFNRPMADLAEKLALITPGALQYSFFVNSGTEAVEGCLKVARLATKRKKFIAARKESQTHAGLPLLTDLSTHTRHCNRSDRHPITAWSVKPAQRFPALWRLIDADRAQADAHRSTARLKSDALSKNDTTCH